MLGKFLLWFHLFFLLITMPLVIAQAAVIQDKDGYTNVRSGKSTKSDVVHKLLDNQVFYADPYDKGSWVAIRYRDKLGKLATGYVHRSRVQLLSGMEVYKGKDIELSFVTQEFDPKSHQIHRRENGGVEKIDGLLVWGTDGGLPRRETTAVTITVKGQKIVIPKEKYANLFQISNKYTLYHKEGYYFAEQINSDGAGTYFVVWVFDQKRLLQTWVSEAE